MGPKVGAHGEKLLCRFAIYRSIVPFDFDIGFSADVWLSQKKGHRAGGNASA